MSTLEIFATIFTVWCVCLANKLNTLQYPIGIIGTILFFFVFYNANLYFSAGLQVFFTLVQLYGWWYWLYGNHGQAPKVTYVKWPLFIGVMLTVPFLFAYLTSFAGEKFNASVPFWDSMIFGLSVIAQFLLDRKKMQSWIVWFIVNIISIFVYYSQGLMLTTGIYVVLLINVFYGYYCWRKSYEKLSN